jgi:PPK2 family polyphosphate:nucleotide phosphotransferase
MAKTKGTGALHRFDGSRKVRLDEIDPRQKTGFGSRADAERRTADDIAEIDVLQDRLYAEARQALLIVLQAMDCGGKDGAVRRVFGPVDPLGIRTASFRRPTPEELAHDFLWRVHKEVPGKGEIGIFNRSHYEDVLVVRVRGLAAPEVVEQRYAQINAFERMLALNGTTIVKIYLHISKEEQRLRLQERVDVPHKRWKFNPGDLEDRALWESYMEAYEIALNRCATLWAPWYVVPADRNWYRNAAVARIIRTALEAMDPQYPEPGFDPQAIRVE